MRIMIGPRDVAAGQMHLLAEELRRRGHQATSVNYYAESGLVQRNADINLGLVSGRRTTSRVVKTLRFTAGAIRRYDVFHFFFGESLVPGNLDLPILKKLNKKIFVHFRGSDIRQRKYLREVVQRRLQGFPMEIDVPPSSPSQLRLIKTWRKYADGIFVSIPELLKIVPEAILIQQTIDLSHWDYLPESVENIPEEILIAHPASSQTTKGTKFVVEAVEQLKSEGYPARLIVIENMPHMQVKEICRGCHIGVDEVIQGSYGNVSVELMALGKPVIANLDPWYSHNRPDLPIVSATPLDLAEKLRLLVDDQRQRRQLGEQGRKYVERWHHVGRVVDQLMDVYRS